MFEIEKIVILDFGSQYTQLIARRIREIGIFSEIVSPEIDLDKVLDSRVKGIILSGGPKSVSESSFTKKFGNIPVLGICYGMQLLNFLNAGTVKPIGQGEYGPEEISLDTEHPLFLDLSKSQNVWMSHGDSIASLAPNFKAIATSQNGLVAAISHKSLPHFGLQFHPEVTHTENGNKILQNFVKLCGCVGEWTIEDHIEKVKDEIKEKVGNGRVVSLVSGGVDSTAATFLCFHALGVDRVFPIHIDSGLMRLNESQEVVLLLKKHGLKNICHLDKSKEFLNALKGVIDPEEKKKIIGDLFIKIIDREISKFDEKEGKTFLCQGTLYTDLIESGLGSGKSAEVIKSHHNVAPKIVKEKREQGLIIEPNSQIFKDEVRKVCVALKIPKILSMRHPFPGPGLAIRILGEVTLDRVEKLRLADKIFIDEITKSDQYQKIWQAFACLLPIKTVGVMGDKRTYGNVVALRAVTSNDGMTADFAKIPYEVLGKTSARIINEVPGVNRVVYDITSKPPGTIEWE